MHWRIDVIELLVRKCVVPTTSNLCPQLDFLPTSQNLPQLCCLNRSCKICGSFLISTSGPIRTLITTKSLMSSPPKDVTFPPPAPADPETPRRPSQDPVPTTLSNPSPGGGIFNPNKSPALKAFFTLQAHRPRPPYIFDRAAGDTLIGAGQYEGQAAKEGEWRCTLKGAAGHQRKGSVHQPSPGGGC